MLKTENVLFPKENTGCVFFFFSAPLTHVAAKHTEGTNWREIQAKCAGTNFKIRMFVPSVCAV